MGSMVCIVKFCFTIMLKSSLLILEEYSSCLYLQMTSMVIWNYAPQQTAVVTHKYEAMQSTILNNMQKLDVTCHSAYPVENLRKLQI